MSQKKTTDQTVMLMFSGCCWCTGSSMAYVFSGIMDEPHTVRHTKHEPTISCCCTGLVPVHRRRHYWRQRLWRPMSPGAATAAAATQAMQTWSWTLSWPPSCAPKPLCSNSEYFMQLLSRVHGMYLIIRHPSGRGPRARAEELQLSGDVADIMPLTPAE